MSLYPGAIWTPGPPLLIYPETNRNLGAILHSAHGGWSPTYTPIDTMNERGVSWPFSIFEDGTTQQHYPITASCFHGGSKYANTNLVGIEFAGTDPLTDAQVASGRALVTWIGAQGQWTPQRSAGLVRTLWEHNEWYPTSCPDGRIPWARFEEDKLETIPVVNADFVEFIKRFGTEGVKVGKIVGQPGKYLVEMKEA